MEELDGLWLAWHVGTLNHHLDASLDQLVSVFLAQLVLCGARQHDIDLLHNLPRSLLIEVLGVRVLLDVLLDSSPLDVLEIKHELQLLFSDAFWVIDHTI